MATSDWLARSWQCPDDPFVRIDLVKGYNGDKYAVRRGSSVLASDGEWEFEPLPSNRDDDFLKRCRFASLADAKAAYDARKVI